MAKIKTPNQKKAYRELAKRLNRYTKRILAIYAVLANEAAKMAISAGYDGDKEFSFDNYPKTKRKVNSLLDFYAENMQTVVYSGITEEWENSNTFQDLLVRRVIKAYSKRIGDKRVKRYYEHNKSAKEAFKKRTINGMNLSQRIWDQRENVKKSLERALSTGIEKGMSAVNLSKRVSKYLNDYPSLAKDYKKKYGKAVDIQSCEYRSVRLARNEINMAYRSAEQERWRSLDFIKGFEIKMSGSHPKEDMCDVLAGIYPSSFRWYGWHVNCMCFAIPIIMSEKEYWSDGPKELYTEVPNKFNKWIGDNVDKIKANKSLPYFLEDNANFIDNESVRFVVRRKTEYIRYKNDPSYKDVEINSIGGFKAVHVSHNTHNYSVKDFFNGTMDGDDLENEFIRVAFSNGHSVIFCEEGKKDKSGNQMTALDMILDGRLMDLASITSSSRDYRNQLLNKSRQLKKFNSREDITTEYHDVCLYFHDSSLFDEKKLIDGYQRMIGALRSKNSSTPLKNVLCAILRKGKLELKEYNF